MKSLMKLNDDGSIIIRLYDGTEKECSNIHKALLYLMKR